MSSFCGKCGQPLAGNDRFCPGCGAPVENHKPVDRKKVTIIIVSLVATALLVIGAVVTLHMLDSNHADRDEEEEVAYAADAPAAVEEAAPAAVEEAAPAAAPAAEEAAPAAVVEAAPEPVVTPDPEEEQKATYRAVSTVFNGRSYYDGSTGGWFELYTGNPDAPFYGYGDIPCMFTYGDILDFQNNTVYLPGDESFHSVNAWTTEHRFRGSDGNEVLETYVDNNLYSIIQAMEDHKGPDYILPYSDTDDMEAAGIMIFGDVARYAKNEIYARYGRKFNDRELQEYFNNRPWYNGTIEPDKFDESMLSDVEKKNVEYLKWCEEI